MKPKSEPISGDDELCIRMLHAVGAIGIPMVEAEIIDVYIRLYGDTHRKKETINERIEELEQRGFIEVLGETRYKGSNHPAYVVTNEGFRFAKGNL